MHGQVGLLDRLLRVVPAPLQRFFFANSGSEAVENAIKVARAHTKKQNIIAFEVSAPFGTRGCGTGVTCRSSTSRLWKPM